MTASGENHGSGGYDPSFYARISQVQDTHFWFRARRYAVETILQPLLSELPPSPLILELGCGDGDLLRVLETVFPSGRVVGMDLYGTGLSYARRRTKALLVRGDVRLPPFARLFDVIGLFDVLEHIPDDTAALQQVAKLLAPGGVLVLSVPADPRLWSYFDEAACHCRRYESSDLSAKLTQAGLEAVLTTPFMCTIHPLLRLGRFLRSRVRTQSSSPQALTESDLRVWPVLNGVLTHLLRREIRGIARGKRMRVGASLLAVAAKPRTS